MHHLSVSISVGSGAYTYFRAFIAAGFWVVGDVDVGGGDGGGSGGGGGHCSRDESLALRSLSMT